MARRRPTSPAEEGRRRTRTGATEPPAGRSRRRTNGAGAPLDLDEEELRALADEQVDAEEVARLTLEADENEQEASDHDRDTARDHLEGLLLERDEDY